MKYIDLPTGQKVIVDDDFETKYKWCLAGAGYASRKDTPTKKIVYLHRVVIGALPGQEVDHINGNKLDNRKANLRIADRSQNNFNRLVKNGRKGIKINRTATKKLSWVAEITVRGKRIYIGSYDTEQAAQEAYDKAARIHFGEFARGVASCVLT